MTHYYLIDKDRHLAHSGTKGMKWGVRRYQNYDGTYTPEGLERYWPGSKHGTRGGGNVTTKTKALKALENGMKGADSPIKKIKLLATDYDPSLLKQPSRSKGQTISRKQDRVATIGLEAIRRLEWYKGDPEFENPEQSTANKEWFLFEDQTPGLKQIVDLIDKGYTPEQVRQTAETLSQCAYGGDSDEEIAAVDAAMTDDESHYVWAMSEAYFNYASHDPDDFAKAVSDIIAEEKGKTRGGEIRTFETTKFGDVKQKSSYITGTDINNGIVKATRANNEDTATAQDNAIKALKSNKSIQDVAQLVGKAYHEYVVEQADYNHVSNKKTIPLLYPSKTKQSDMQASHEKLGKAQAAMSAEIRSMMRIALEKDYNKKTPYTSKGKPITYGELANKAVMQILKESNSKANRKDMLNVTLAARDYNRKQARRGSTVDEAKLERQRSEISKLRGKVYDEWGNIIDQKAYKQLQRAKADYKKTKQG